MCHIRFFLSEKKYSKTLNSFSFSSVLVNKIKTKAKLFVTYEGKIVICKILINLVKFRFSFLVHKQFCRLFLEVCNSFSSIFNLFDIQNDESLQKYCKENFLKKWFFSKFKSTFEFPTKI